MARLVYSMNTSLDGYATDAKGSLDWSVPSTEVHRFFNELESSTGIALYGRRLYETMVYWDSPQAVDGRPAVEQEYAKIWRGIQKVVFSKTLEDVSGPNARLERTFDPAAIAKLKASETRNISVGGPTLAAQALAAGLVDDIQLVVAPIILGGGLRALPADLRLELELVNERRFDNGAMLLHYRTKR